MEQVKQTPDGKWKCNCGRVLARVGSIEKHMETKSHKASLEWKSKLPNKDNRLLTKKMGELI